LSDGFLFVMRECSRSYMTGEQTKRRWKDSQKQSDMNFRQYSKQVLGFNETI